MTDRDRRGFLTGALTAVGVAATAGSTGVWAALAQGAAPATKTIIDVHHHYGPPTWVAAMKGNPMLQAANTTWTPEKSLEDMDRGGAAAAVLSITNPGLYIGDKTQATHRARECDHFGAKVAHARPTRSC